MCQLLFLEINSATYLCILWSFVIGEHTFDRFKNTAGTQSNKPGRAQGVHSAMPRLDGMCIHKCLQLEMGRVRA